MAKRAVPTHMAGSRPRAEDTLDATILHRDGYECQRCGAVGEPLGNVPLYVHHFGGAFTESNLVTVCGRCLNELEPSSREGFELEVRVSWYRRLVRGVVAAVSRLWDRASRRQP